MKGQERQGLYAFAITCELYWDRMVSILPLPECEAGKSVSPPALFIYIHYFKRISLEKCPPKSC